MDSKNRMDGCVCANGAKVAEIVHPYCPAHVPPEMEAELASLRAHIASETAKAAESVRCFVAQIGELEAEVERLKSTVNDLNHRAIHTTADLEDAREEVERLKSRPVGVPGEVRETISTFLGHASLPFATTTAEASEWRCKRGAALDWIASLDSKPAEWSAGYDGSEGDDRPPPWQIDTEEA